MDYSGVPSVFDRGRGRFYALAAGKVVSVDPATGLSFTLVADAADVPRASTDTGNQLALSASGTFLYIAASSDNVTRYNFVTGQIDQRLALPPAPADSARLLNAVLASNTVDEEVYVRYTEVTPAIVTPSSTIQIWLTKVQGATWSQQRLLLERDGTLRMKPDDTQILFYANGFRRIRVGPDGALTFDGAGSVLPMEPYYPSIAPTYVGPGILFKNAVFDATSLQKLYDIPAMSCSALASGHQAICVGPGETRHALFVYDLVLRRVLASWSAGFPPLAVGLGPPAPTGWVSEAGPSQVLVYYSWNVYKGFNQTGLYLYEHPSLN